MKTNFNNCSDIEGIRFFTKEICPYYFRFLHTKKDSGGASIHKIDELFLLRLPLEHFFLIPKGQFRDLMMTCTVGTVEVVLSGGHPPIDYRVK